jgi:hypothetical protein
MAEQRTPTEIKIETPVNQAELDLAAAVARRKELKKNLRVTLLERSAVSSALKVDLPANVHGEWVRNDPLRINDMRALGFEVDKQFAPKQSLHDANADGTAVVGDLIFMTCPIEVKEVIEEIRAEEYIRRHGKPGEINALTQEERGFIAEQQTLVGSHIGTSNESAAAPVRLSAGNANLK